MTTIPEGYDLIAEGICTFYDNPKTYSGSWYHCEEEDIYYFLLHKKGDSDDELEDDDYEGEIYPVEEENMVYDDVEVYGWFSKTMENYTFAVLPEEEEEEEEEDEEDEEGSFWKSLKPKEEESEEDEDLDGRIEDCIELHHNKNDSCEDEDDY
jgi:hypothetical protein